MATILSIMTVMILGWIALKNKNAQLCLQEACIDGSIK